MSVVSSPGNFLLEMYVFMTRCHPFNFQMYTYFHSIFTTYFSALLVSFFGNKAVNKCERIIKYNKSVANY